MVVDDEKIENCIIQLNANRKLFDRLQILKQIKCFSVNLMHYLLLYKQSILN